MLKRKRFHPDETYDSMVVSFSSDDAISVDPVHGNGKFTCNLNNVNSVTHTRKLLPLRAHVPNTYNNITEGANTIQYSLDVSREFELKSPDNEFEFDYVGETTEVTGYPLGYQFNLPAFGHLQATAGTSPYNLAAGTKVKAVVPVGVYTLESLTIAIEQAIYDICKADYDYRFGVTGQHLVWDMNEWLTRGVNFATGASISGWESMTPAYSTPDGLQRSLQFSGVSDIIDGSLYNTWACSNVNATGVTPTGTWPNHPPINQPLLDAIPTPGILVFGDKYKRIALVLTFTASQQSLLGVGATMQWGPPDLSASLPSDSYSVAGTSERGFAMGTASDGSSVTALSSPFTITPGYYNKAQLADAIDTAMKAAVHQFPFFWLHRIRNYYDGGGFDSDVDLRRCEYDATADVFKFYFSPALTGVPAPSQDLVTTYPYENRYGDNDSVPSEVISISGNSSFLRMLGLSTDNSLALPTDANMTILQSVSGSPCPQIDIPYVYITSPQVSRNNVLTSDSRNRNILATIPMTGVPRCEYGHYTGVDIYVDNIDYKGPTSLDKVEFTVTDDRHNQLTIPEHTPVSISLKVYHDDTDP